MFQLFTEPSSGFFLSLKLHIVKNVHSLVHFLSTVFTTFTVIDVHSHLVSCVKLINWYFVGAIVGIVGVIIY
jgi:hypothetical protein